MNFPFEKDLLENLFNDTGFKKFISSTNFLNDFEWFSWFQQNSKYLSVKDQARIIYKIKFYEKNVFNETLIKEEIWNSVENYMLSSSEPPINKIRGAIKRLLPYAAIFAAIFFGIIWWYYKPINNANVENSYVSGYEKKSFQLPDQTKLTLNKNSKAFYTVNDSMRVLRIYGEGYLEVAKVFKNNRNIPFKVENDAFAVEVLGTRFNFIGSQNSKSVALFEGSVKVSDNSSEFILKPGDVVYSKGGRLEKKNVDADLFMSWNSGILKLNNTSLKDIIEWLEVSRGLNIENQLSNQVLTQTISGEIEINDEQTLFKTLGDLYNLKIIQSKNKVIIQNENMNN